MGWIYQIENLINHKKYIGKTEYANPELRWHEHLRDYKKATECARPLYRAMSKYGVDNFEFTVLEETNDTSSREQYYIQLFNTYGSTGYNATLGGEGTKTLDYDKIKIYWEQFKDTKTLQEIAKDLKIDRNSIPKALKSFGIDIEPNPQDVIDYFLNNDVTQRETAKHFNMSECWVSNLFTKYNITKRPTEQEVVDYYLNNPSLSQKDVADHFHLRESSVSRIICRTGNSGKRQRASSKGKYTKVTGIIKQYDLEGNLINQYASAVDAAKSCGRTDPSNINACCRGAQKTAYGYKWEREDIS